MKTHTKFKLTEIGEIPEDWKVKTLETVSVEIIDGDRGVNYPNGKDFSDFGYCLFLNTKNVPDTKFEFTEKMFITKEKDEQLRKGKLKRNDIVLTTRGTVGNMAIYDSNIPFEHIRINSGMVIIRNLQKEFNTNFLFQILRSPIFRSQVLSFFTGSAQPQLPIRDLKKIYVLIPSLNEQHSIAKILSDLDSKIELNQQMNKTLEAIGQAIFKRWFIDFEFPNEKGKPYKSSGGEVVDSELGQIPKGWGVGNVLNEFNLTMGQSPPGSTYNEAAEGVSFFQGRTDFGFRFPTKRIFCTLPARFAEPGDTLVSVRAPVGDINMATEKCCVGRGVAGIRHKTGSRSYTYYSMQNLREKFLHFEAEGTVFGSIGKTDFEKIRIIIPSKEIINLFEKILYHIDQKIENNFFSNESLLQIRGRLLPRLMSGKIRVPVEV